MSRPKSLKDAVVFSTRLERKDYEMLQDIAALESLTSGEHVSVQDLIRNAIKYVYSDNERLRECFRRTRNGWKNKMKDKSCFKKDY